jgi:RNA polymerase sigma-70 factor (ECF subfamily)
LVADQPSLEDRDVVARVRAGETALFEILLRRYNQRLFRAVRAIVRADAEAEDVLQQAWLSAYTHLQQWTGEAQLSTWLTRIAINEALARVRQRKRQAEVDLEEHDVMKPLISQTRTPEAEAQGRELALLLERAIDELPDGYRMVYMMREVQQLSVTETADCLELSEENVKVRLHRARGMLRDALEARLDEAATGAFQFLGHRCDRLVANVLAAITRSG